MPIDPSQFGRHNVVDTCAVWNVLSSLCLHSASVSAGCTFCVTGFVNYECLHKPRKRHSDYDAELQQRLRQAQGQGSFRPYMLSIEDLQDVEVLQNRKRLSKGELSSIVFARKTRQALLSDDRKARRLADDVLGRARSQTTPLLFGWLIYNRSLGDGDKDLVVAQHEAVGRPLRRYLEEAYLEALRCRAML
jgi:hypothetical protein